MPRATEQHAVEQHHPNRSPQLGRINRVVKKVRAVPHTALDAEHGSLVGLYGLAFSGESGWHKVRPKASPPLSRSRLG